MTTPTEFVLWLNGALDIIGDNPSPEQWASIREKMSEATGYLAKLKLLEKAEELSRKEEETKRKAVFAQQAVDAMKAQHAQRLREQMDKMVYEHLRQGPFDPTLRIGGSDVLGLPGRLGSLTITKDIP